MRKTVLTVLALTILIYNAYAAVLGGFNCPDTLYQWEEVNCSLILYSQNESIVSVVLFKSASGLISINPTSSPVSIDRLLMKNVPVTVHAKETGYDVITAELISQSSGNTEAAFLKPITIEPSPVRIEVPSINVDAGTSKAITVSLEGRALDVRVYMESLSDSVYVEGEKRMLALDGREDIQFTVSTSPYFVGNVSGYVVVEFTDERGRHVLKVPVTYSVSPPFILAVIIAAVLVALIVLGYRRIKEKISGTNEPQ